VHLLLCVCAALGWPTKCRGERTPSHAAHLRVVPFGRAPLPPSPSPILISRPSPAASYHSADAPSTHAPMHPCTDARSTHAPMHRCQVDPCTHAQMPGRPMRLAQTLAPCERAANTWAWARGRRCNCTTPLSSTPPCPPTQALAHPAPACWPHSPAPSPLRSPPPDHMRPASLRQHPRPPQPPPWRP
jgi:hypothetical protein